MEYNEKYKILFEKSILKYLIYGYVIGLNGVEVIDEIYSKVRMFNYKTDKPGFIYRGQKDYNKLLKYVNNFQS